MLTLQHRVNRDCLLFQNVPSRLWISTQESIPNSTHHIIFFVAKYHFWLSHQYNISIPSGCSLHASTEHLASSRLPGVISTLHNYSISNNSYCFEANYFHVAVTLPTSPRMSISSTDSTDGSVSSEVSEESGITLTHVTDKPSFSGTADQNGNTLAPTLPILLDQVMDGREITSNFRLMTLESHILCKIVQLFDFRSLESFALVDRDCRQLARTRQFSTFRFSYSRASRKLLSLLLAEAHRRNCVVSFDPKERKDRERYRYLGSCIQRIIVKSKRELVAPLSASPLAYKLKNGK